MSDEERGDTQVGLDASDLIAQLHPHLRVEGRERFIEEQHPRPRHQGSGEGDSLLLATGELVCVAPGEVAETDEIECPRRASATFGGRDLAHPKPELHVLDRREVRKERVGLEDHADVPLVHRHVDHVDAVDQDAATVHLLESRECAQGRGLAATRRAEQRHELPRSHREADPGEGTMSGVVLHDIDELNGCAVVRRGGHEAFFWARVRRSDARRPMSNSRTNANARASREKITATKGSLFET